MPFTLVFSYAKLSRIIESIATEVCEVGVRPHTVCAFVLPSRIETIVYFLALQMIGDVAVPMHPALGNHCRPQC